MHIRRGIDRWRARNRRGVMGIRPLWVGGSDGLVSDEDWKRVMMVRRVAVDIVERDEAE